MAWGDEATPEQQWGREGAVCVQENHPTSFPPMPCQCLPLAEPSSEQNSNRTRWYSLRRPVFWDTSMAEKIRKQMVQWGRGKMCCFLNKGYKYGKEWKHLNGRLSLPPWQMEERKLREVVLLRLSARKRNRFGALNGALVYLVSHYTAWLHSEWWLKWP